MDQFQILCGAYLEPFIEKRPSVSIGIYENILSGVVRRAFVGLEERRNVKSKCVQPIMFDNQILGTINAESDDLDAFSSAETKILKFIADQIGPLFAWQERPWSARLDCLGLLHELKSKNPKCNWVGIYRKGTSNKDLSLSAFIGEPTEHIHIPVSVGICGAAFREERTINVPNTLADPRFIACSLTTQSEIVVPIRNRDGQVVAELDIDSDTPEAFTPDLAAKVEACAQRIENISELFEV
jgi:L-methionine (R)-S-oxide reductase